MMIIFKIRNGDGLFSKGGWDADKSERYWSKRGKNWSSIGALKNHLNQLRKVPSDWEIVEYQIDENTGMTTSFIIRNAAEFALTVKNERDKKKEKLKLKRLQYDLKYTREREAMLRSELNRITTQKIKLEELCKVKL